MVAGLNFIAPGDAGYLWEALGKSGSVEKELGVGEQQEDRTYYGRALPEGKQGVKYYQSWETLLHSTQQLC